jgi:hypothetical protein
MASTDAKIWHVSDDGKEDGPFSEAEVKALIKQGAFSRSAMVWKEGRTEWRPMFPSAKPPPPPVPPLPVVPYRSPEASPSHSPNLTPRVIEQTAKKWKTQLLLAAGCMILGVVLICSGGTTGRRPGEPNPVVIFGVLSFLGGLVWYVVARLLAWWNHG